jgi:hypothetical protein
VNSSEAVALYQSQVVPAVQAALQNLARITDPNFLLTLTSEETAVENVTVDYGDVLLLRGLLHGAQFLGYTLNAHNFSVVLNKLNDLAKAEQLTLQRVLAEYPQLLAPASAADRTSSKAAFTNAILRYQEASAFIRTTRPPGADRLFTLLPEDEAKEAEVRDYLDTVLASVNGPAPLPPRDALAPWLNAGAYFAGGKSLRSLLPRFRGDTYVYNSLPDYTFGGLLLNEPDCDTEAALREELSAPSFAGCYAGYLSRQGGGDSGQFGLFVQTNRQARLIGYDFNNGSGLFSQFNLQEGGDWDFHTNNIASWGRIHSDGTLDGGYWSPPTDGWLWGYRDDAADAYQSAAGYYTGTWRSGGQSGQLLAILCADGQLFYSQFNPAGRVADGGSGQLDNANSHNPDSFYSRSVQGISVTGTLNTTNLSIGGTTSDGIDDGTFRLTRAAFVAGDTSPTVTKWTTVPTNDWSNYGARVTVAVGGTATFTATASGSPPLCYQWYSNGVALARATAPTLVVTNVQFSNGGLYAVTVRNVAGSTSRETWLNVVPETVRPTVTITAPVTGQRWSNEWFNVTGTASDNVGVAEVWCQVNDNQWALAHGTNHWSLEAFLVPGTNTVRAYALDLSGNESRPVSNSVIYIVSDRITLATNPPAGGTVSGVANGQLLELNRNYTATATPKTAQGWAFTNWTGGTDPATLVLLTNQPVLQFTMDYNLIVQANFTDLKKPELAITNPLAGLRVSNAFVNVKGWARDNDRVSQVWAKLNQGTYQPAQSANNWTNWTLPDQRLTPGTNWLLAYATDATGNRSPTVSNRVIYVLSDRLTLVTNPPAGGTIGGVASGQLLELNRNYTATATARPGYLFSSWTDRAGQTLTNRPVCLFLMESNLVLQANFVTNLFLAAKGNYYGLFYPLYNQSASNSGYFTLTLSEPGTFSGRLLLAGATLPFSSNFTVTGQAHLPVARPGGTPLRLMLNLLPAEGRISGMVEGSAGYASLLADRAAPTNRYAGSYSLAMAGAGSALDSPAGLGAGQLTVAADASVQVAGTLADSAALSQQTGVSLAGQWPLYASLYGGRGLVMGWMQLNSNAPALWLLPPQATNRYYSNGFALTRDVVVARYRAPAAGQRVLNWTNGLAIVGGGNLPAPLTNQVVLTNNQFRVLGGSLSNLTLSLTLPNGAFTGSFKHPVTGLATAVKGTVVQDPLGLYPVGSGGWFLGTNQGGYILIRAATP